MVSLAIGGASGFVPVRVGPFAELIKYGTFGLWTITLLISLSALVASARRPNVPGEQEAPVFTGRGLLVLSIVLMTALLLGTLMYFVPLR